MFYLNTKKKQISKISPFDKMYFVGEKDTYLLQKRKVGVYAKIFGKKFLTRIPKDDISSLEETLSDKILGLSFTEQYNDPMVIVARGKFGADTTKVVTATLDYAKKISGKELSESQNDFFKKLLIFLAKKNIVDEFFTSIKKQQKEPTLARCVLEEDSALITNCLAWSSAINIDRVGGWSQIYYDFQDFIRDGIVKENPHKAVDDVEPDDYVDDEEEEDEEDYVDDEEEDEEQN